MTSRIGALVLSAIVLAAGVAGCGGDAGPARWAGTVDTVGGVPIVRNPAEPIHPTGWARLERVWRQAGPVGGDPWHEPHNLAASGGEVFVLDREIQRVYRLDGGTGEQETAFGRQGSGPNEMAGPLDIAAAGAGEVLILDRGILKRFDGLGLERGSQRIAAIGFDIAPLGLDRFMLSGFGTGSRLSIIEGDSLRALDIPLPRAGLEAELGSCERLDAAAGLVVAIACVVPYFRTFRADGPPVREVAVARDPMVRPQAQLDSMIDRMRASIGEVGLPAEQVEAMVREQREAQRFLRPFTSVRHDAVSGWISLLEQELNPYTATAPTLHLFDGDGRYRAALRDSVFWWDYDFLDGDIVALTRDPATGLVAAVRYRVVTDG